MIKARFYVNLEDPRPVTWPVKHPYWISGYGTKGATLVAYADNEEEILKNWPEATDIDTAEVQGYSFTERFPQPSWWENPNAC